MIQRLVNLCKEKSMLLKGAYITVAIATDIFYSYNTGVKCLSGLRAMDQRTMEQTEDLFGIVGRSITGNFLENTISAMVWPLSLTNYVVTKSIMASY